MAETEGFACISFPLAWDAKDQIDSCCNHTTADNHADYTKPQQRVENYDHTQNAKQKPKYKRYPPV